MAYPKQGPYPTQPQPQVAGYPPQQQAGAYPPPEQGGAYPPPQGQQPPPPYYPQQGPPPPQAQQQQQVTTTVIQAQPAVVAPVRFGPYPVTITDSQGRQVQTILDYRASATTHILALVICCVGLFLFWPALCFFWLPYVMDGTKDVYHISPTDGNVVGVYRR